MKWAGLAGQCWWLAASLQLGLLSCSPMQENVLDSSLWATFPSHLCLRWAKHGWRLRDKQDAHVGTHLDVTLFILIAILHSQIS